jgi:hypothetical protein
VLSVKVIRFLSFETEKICLCYSDRSVSLDFGSHTELKFAIVITQYRNNRVEVFLADILTHPRFNDAIDRVMQLKQRQHVSKLYCDSSNPEVVSELKSSTMTITVG